MSTLSAVDKRILPEKGADRRGCRQGLEYCEVYTKAFVLCIKPHRVALRRPYILQLCREEERRKAPVTPPLVDEGIEFRSPKKRKRSSTPDDEVVEIPKPTSSKNAQRSGLSPTPASGSSSMLYDLTTAFPY